ERVGGGGGGEADLECVEVIEHAFPEVVDGAVALINDDKVEGFRRQVRIIKDRPGFIGIYAGLVGGTLVGLIANGFAGQGGVKALDGRDDDLGAGLEPNPVEALDDVFVSEAALGIRAMPEVEFVFGLPTKVAAVHEEENSVSVGEFDEPVTLSDRH